jgi:hypothetical protein
MDGRAHWRRLGRRRQRHIERQAPYRRTSGLPTIPVRVRLIRERQRAITTAGLRRHLAPRHTLFPRRVARLHHLRRPRPETTRSTTSRNNMSPGGTRARLGQRLLRQPEIALHTARHSSMSPSGMRARLGHRLRLTRPTARATPGPEKDTVDQTASPKWVRISRRPILVTRRARLSKSWTNHFRFSATFRSAAPIAPPR